VEQGGGVLAGHRVHRGRPVNSAGNIAIGTSETTGGGRVGVMNGDTFTPLPGVTGFEAIAW
jgi:hypothetical protein